MTGIRCRPALAAIAILTATHSLHAATRTTDVDPSSSFMGVTQQTCLQRLTNTVSTGENCMYDGGAAQAQFTDPVGEATGPFSQGYYYDSVATPQAFVPPFDSQAGDGKIRQVINGTITIDDNGNGFGSDDLLSFELTFTSPGAGDVIRNLGLDLAERYTSMTQVLDPTPVNSATPNSEGGFDYVIGSEGFPVRLTFTDASANESAPGANDGPCVGQAFGDMECDAGFASEDRSDPLRWDPWLPTDGSTFDGQFPVPHNGPAQSAGLSSLEGNLGVRTTGTVEGLQCADDGEQPTGAPSGATLCTAGRLSWNPLVNGPNQAPGGGAGAEDVGWDQLLLRVSTDASGNVISAEGFDVQEYVVFGPPGACGSDPGATAPCNTWVSGYFEIAGEPAPTAVDDAAQTIRDAAVDIDVLANDLGFVDDVTLTLPGSGVSANGGTVAIIGANPGPQAGLLVTYSPAAGFFGPDSFDYTVEDSANQSTATVNVEVLDIGANDDTATARFNTPLAGIPVGANDSGFEDPVVVTIAVAPDQGGSATVNGSNGPINAVTIDYEPSAPLGTATYSETFSYQVTDADDVTDTATVTVTVNNALPVAVATAASAGEGDAAVVDVAALAGVEFGDPPSEVSISSDPANGTAGAAGNTLTYTPTGFFTGNDSFAYVITDVDGETSSATVTVNIGPKRVPTANPDSADVDQDGSIDIDVTANDLAGSGPLADHDVAVSTPPTNGSASVGPGNAIRYAPTTGFTGSDSFEYTLTDLDGDAATATVTVTVTATQVDVPLPGRSAADPVSLALLAVLPWLRRRRRSGICRVSGQRVQG